MSLAREVKKKAKEVGFAVVGISNVGLLRDLPYGNIRYIGELTTPEAELPTVKSVIVMGFLRLGRSFQHSCQFMADS